MITGESRPVSKKARRPGRRRNGVDRLVDACTGRRRRRRNGAGRDPASRRRRPGQPQPRPGARRPLRRHPLLRRHRRWRGDVRGLAARRQRRRCRRANGHGARHRLPARPRVGDPAGDHLVDRRLGEGRHPRQGPARPRADAPRRHGAVRQDRHADPGGPRRHGSRRDRAISTRSEALRLAAAVEADSEHPLAKAIVAAAQRHGTVPRASDFRALTGRGVEATVDGTPYAVGGPALLRERQLAVPTSSCIDIDEWRRRGAAVLHLVRGDDVVGAFALEDAIRPEAKEAVDELRNARDRRGDDHRRCPSGRRRRRPANSASTRCSPRYSPRTRTRR